MYVSRRLRVFDDPVLAPLVLHDRLSVSTAEELLRVDPASREEFAKQAVKERWERPQVRAFLSERNAALQLGERLPRLSSRIRALREELAGLDLAVLPTARRNSQTHWSRRRPQARPSIVRTPRVQRLALTCCLVGASALGDIVTEIQPYTYCVYVYVFVDLCVCRHNRAPRCVCLDGRTRYCPTWPNGQVVRCLNCSKDW
jgi:hypothetical protein